MIDPLSITLLVSRGLPKLESNHNLLLCTTMSLKTPSYRWIAAPGNELIDSDGTKVGEISVLVGHWEPIDSCPDCEEFDAE